MMYEPPNRGRKTWNTFGRVPGGNDPGSDHRCGDARQRIPDAARLLDRVERLGRRPRARATPASTPPSPCRWRKNPDGSTITGPAYEYIVTGAASFALSYPAATLDKTKATLTHRVHLDDTPDEILPARLELQRRRHRDQPGRQAASSTTTSTNSATRPRIRPSTAWALPPCATSTPSRYARPSDAGTAIRSRATCSASTPRSSRSRDVC